MATNAADCRKFYRIFKGFISYLVNLLLKKTRNYSEILNFKWKITLLKFQAGNLSIEKKNYMDFMIQKLQWKSRPIELGFAYKPGWNWNAEGRRGMYVWMCCISSRLLIDVPMYGFWCRCGFSRIFDRKFGKASQAHCAWMCFLHIPTINIQTFRIPHS